ncbi:MAG: hypothetical protein E7179_06275 [Erysipelotrichaceae bacterium]|jgi:hypothetical protein|nr:hypothetical protein [Erysipelotrichaceae bacterium]
MQKIIDFIKGKYSLFLPILLFAYLIAEILGISTYLGGGAGAMVATVFYYLLDIGIAVLFAILFVKKKEDVIAFLLMIMVLVFGYRSFLNFPSGFNSIGGDAIFTIHGLLSVLVSVSAGYVFVLYVVRRFKEIPSDLARSGKYVALGIIPLAVLTGIFYIVVLARLEAHWSSYFSAISSYFAYMPLMAMTYIARFHEDPVAVIVESEPKEEQAEAPAEEVAPEEPKEEKPAEEEPFAQEPHEEPSEEGEPKQE